MSKAFDYNNLYTKAQEYIERANDSERDSSLYPFWLSLSLEFLIRSSLAKIHPSLLADTPNSNDYKSLLYSFGYEVTNQPKSIQISTAVNRLGDIIEEFTTNLRNKVTLIIYERNTELHSGLSGFDEFPVSLWISDYYRICDILLKFQEKTLKEYFGEDEGVLAEKMIEESDEKLKKIVIDKIKAYKQVYEDLALEEKANRKEYSDKQLRVFNSHTKKVDCPCCKNEALLTGEQVSVSSTKLNGNDLYEEIRYIPNKLACFNCGLKLDTYNELKVVDLGHVFTIDIYVDPVEYHGIDPEEYVNVDELVERKMREINYGMEYMDE
jgi:hypothetical protein